MKYFHLICFTFIQYSDCSERIYIFLENLNYLVFHQTIKVLQCASQKRNLPWYGIVHANNNARKVYINLVNDDYISSELVSGTDIKCQCVSHFYSLF